MAQFHIDGDIDPFLRCDLDGEAIYCESDAMVMMDDTLELSAEVMGGIGRGLARKFLANESFFMQKIQTTRGPGTCVLAPAFHGGMKVLDVAPGSEYCVSDGSFVACTAGVNIDFSRQKIAGAMFGSTGGLFVMRASGVGKLAVCGRGKIASVQCRPGRELTIDAGHVVAWATTLQYTPTLRVNNTKKYGLGQHILNSALSGEGVVTRFSGVGQIFICSRFK